MPEHFICVSLKFYELLVFFSFSELLPLFRPGKFCFIIVTWHLGRILSGVIYDIWLESGQKRGSAKCHEEFDKFMPHLFWCMIFYFGHLQNISPTSRWGSSSSFRTETVLSPFLTILIPKRGSLTNQSCVTRILTGV